MNEINEYKKKLNLLNKMIVIRNLPKDSKIKFIDIINNKIIPNFSYENGILTITLINNLENNNG